ncbi:hypothetical protein QUC31_019588 [Theobroma cacao]|uniref:Uncharacterized protein LOC18589381 n=2 Tax=Theobroma cacao TaxID=3641 RepID=A0AB32UR02_THECC|nr:PREDICTED: uncharacterized protein LOC18589381 [Theobroma cacao]EOY32008.1 Uncharacterized protein TCM_039416 [Theobroma cacao]
MGCSFSRGSSSTVKNIIRVVHLNGYVEDFEYPVSVGQLTGKPPKQFLCTPAQLISGCSQGLQPDTILEAGRIYFLLPYSTLHPDVSPADLASLARKLSAKAKSTNCKAKSPTSSQYSHGSSPLWNSLGRSPNRLRESDSGMKSHGAQSSSRVRTWRPVLDTIREKSFNRRSESDLQET